MELLAPVGNENALFAAINNGADAVYLGLDSFNARSKANFFNKSNIKKYIDLCHLHGVKVYITFNTCIKDDEIESFKDYLIHCANCHVDAFIVTDFAILELTKNLGIPLHASTQMGVHNVLGALILKELGYTRIVLSREATIEDIIAIKKETNLEIEYFVHGALCVAFSGSCLLSGITTGDSGNRGRCNQLCRLKFKNSLTNETKYFISPSDQCLIKRVNELQEAGVDSFKIEGRLKAPHYVGETVKQYRNAIDGKQFNIRDLKRAFNRGKFTEGYSFDSTNEIMSTIHPGNIGIKIGKVIGNNGKYVLADFNEEPSIGDGLKIIKDEIELGGFELDNLDFDTKGRYSFATLKRYPIGSDINLTYDVKQVQKYNQPVKKIELDVELFAKTNNQSFLAYKYNDIIAKVPLEVCKAINQPTLVDDIKIQLSKLGDTNFTIRNINIDVEDNIFIPKSILNSKRRECIEVIYNTILSNYEKKSLSRIIIKNQADESVNNFDNYDYYIEVQNNNQLNEFIVNNAEIVYEIESLETNIFFDFMNKIKSYNSDKKIYLKFSKIARTNDIIYIRKYIEKNLEYIKGLLCDNLYAITLAKHYHLDFIIGIGLNVYNHLSYNFYKKLGAKYIIPSVELTDREIDYNIKNNRLMKYVFGRVSVMSFAHCLIQNIYKSDCDNCKYKGSFKLSSKQNFIVIRKQLNSCFFEMYTDKIINLSNNNYNRSIKKYLNMLNFNCNEVENILKSFINGKSLSNIERLQISELGVK